MEIDLDNMKAEYHQLKKHYELLEEHISIKTKQSLTLQQRLTDLMVAIKKYEHGWI